MRKYPCKKCGKWFINPGEKFVKLPDKYDYDLCPKCNELLNKNN